MNACIYARTSRIEKRHHTVKLEHQVAFCRELATRFNFTVAPEHIFTDIELTGDLLPTCWAAEAAPSRPALAALVAAVEAGEVQRVLVRRVEKLGTTSEVLDALRQCFEACGVRVVAAREVADDPDDPTAQFALVSLRTCLQFEGEDDRERRQRLRARKLDELARLRAKLARLEAEIAAL